MLYKNDVFEIPETSSSFQQYSYVIDENLP